MVNICYIYEDNEACQLHLVLLFLLSSGLHTDLVGWW